MKELGFDADNLEEIDFNEIIGKELKVVMNDDYYVKTEYGTYSYNTDLAAMYNAENTLTLRISCIVRPKEDSPTSMMSEGGGVAYNDELAQLVIDNSKNSEIVKAQEQSDVNVLSMEAMDEETKRNKLLHISAEMKFHMPFSFILMTLKVRTKCLNIWISTMKVLKLMIR